jgi:stearoyl-CoA desaturase (delta-9 desaturase)
VIWGICVRISVCVTGHWLVGHFAHRRGDRSFIVDGAAGQGYNVAWAGFISMGESWHNNHHAFPDSARMGLFPGQIDPGWWLIKSLEAVGLVANVKTPDDLPFRPELRRLSAADGSWLAKSLPYPSGERGHPTRSR